VGDAVRGVVGVLIKLPGRRAARAGAMIGRHDSHRRHLSELGIQYFTPA